MTALDSPTPTAGQAASPAGVGAPTARNRKATTEQIVAAYRETGTVWEAGKRLGMAGQSIHERLRVIGYPLPSRNWTDAEVNELRALLAAECTLGEVARRLGRPYAGVAGKASELGVRTVRRRQKKLPRGAGWDKATTLRHMKALELYSGRVTQYARANGLAIELFVQAMQKHWPDRWKAYVETRSDLPTKTCPYCESEFIPMSGKQSYCDRKCAADARADRSYFGGKRRNTVGLAEGVCQLCGRVGVKGLSSHHVFGKENDPENETLIALCPGCHNIITWLGGRAFVDDSVAWESLISLAWLRRHGPEAGEQPPGSTLHVTVEIEQYVEDEDEVTSGELQPLPPPPSVRAGRR